jgi:hypothetical protein
MMSNTGCTSVGDSLITARISAVAVCLSSASFVSRNSRAFWIAITAWSAKVLKSAFRLRFRIWSSTASRSIAAAPTWRSMPRSALWFSPTFLR